MAKLYQQKGSSKYYAHVKIWSDKDASYMWKRISTGSKCEDTALNIAEAFEKASEQVKPLAGKTISKDHVSNILMSILASAGVSVEGDIEYPLFSEVSDKYMSRLKGKTKIKTFNTYETYCRKIDKWLEGESVTVDFFSEEKCEEFYADLLELSSNKSANEVMRHLKRVIGSVVPKILTYNPVSEVKLAPNKGGETLARLPFSMIELHTMIYHLTNSPREREFRTATIVAASTSCRLADALGMHSDNLKDGVITYTQEKTGKRVSVPIVNEEWLSELESINGYFCPILKSDVDRGMRTLSSEYVDMIEPYCEQSYKWFEKSGHRVARKTFHSLRHTVYSSLIANGATAEQANLISGHSGNQGKTYTHANIETARELLKGVFNQ